jgi:hypothetical protein
MGYIEKAFKTNKGLDLTFSEKQVLGTHIFIVSKEQANKLKKDASKGQAILKLTPDQVKRFVRKEGRGLFKDLTKLQKEADTTQKELVKKDLKKKLEKQKLSLEILDFIKTSNLFKDIDEKKQDQLLQSINEKMVLYGLVKQPKRGKGARQAFLSICDKLGIKTELGECHLRGHNYTGPGTKIEEKIANLEEIDEKFKGKLNKLTLKDLKFKDDKWKPINKIDEISAVHDVQYRLAGKQSKDSTQEINLQNEADKIMATKLRQVKKGNPTNQEKYEYYLVYPAIVAKMDIENSGPVKAGLLIKDNITDLYETAKGSKTPTGGLFSITTRTMEYIAERLGLKKTSARTYGNIWNTLLEASVDFTKDIIGDAIKLLGAKASKKEIDKELLTVEKEITLPTEATKEEYEKELEDIKKLEFKEIERNKEEVNVEEVKEEVKPEEPKTAIEEAKEEAQEVAEELPPQQEGTVLLTAVKPKPKRKRGKGMSIKTPKSYKKIHPLYTDEIEEFATLNNITPYDFVMRNGERPDINEKEHYMLINLDDKNGPGTHYTGIFIKNKEATYFDPFGLPPPKEIKLWLKNNDLSVQYTSNQLQNKHSIMCGYYVSLFLYMMKNKVSPYEFLYEKEFEHNDIKKNDALLKEYFKL